MGNKYGIVVLLVFFNVAVSVTKIQNITTCDAGTFLSLSEDGEICLMCPGGTFMSLKNHTKNKCDDCTKLEDQTLELLITPCVSTRDADIQCVEGYFRQPAKSPHDKSFCIECTPTCPKGHVQVHLCQNFTDLGCCPGENYDYAENENGIPYCRERPVMCGRGQFLDTQVNNCKPCPNHTFMPENYHFYTQCWDCQYKSEAHLPPHSRIIQTCTSTQPSLYGCKDGFYFSSRLHGVRCSPCQTCDEGKYVGRQCEMYHDTVCCDKPNMTVENGSQGESCVVEDRKYVGGEADDSTSILWLILGLVIILLIVGIICVIYKKRLQKLVQDTFLRRNRRARGDGVPLKQASSDNEVTKERNKLREENDEKSEHSVGQNQTVPNIIRPQTIEQQNGTSQRTQENAVVRELRMCLKSLKRNEVEAQASTAKRLGEMARDERVRQKILEFSDLMQKLESLQESKHSRVRKNVTQALQVIKGTTSATNEGGHLPAQTDHVSKTDAVITIQGATPTTSEKNCLTAALDIELNSSTDISVHESTTATDERHLPASSLTDQQTDHTGQGRGDTEKLFE